MISWTIEVVLPSHVSGHFDGNTHRDKSDTGCKASVDFSKTKYLAFESAL